MNADLRAPGDRYRVAIDVTSAVGGDQVIRRTVEQGVAFRDVGGPVRSEAGAVQGDSYIVVVDDLCSLVLIPGENGLTVRWVRLLNAAQATIRARVIAGAGAHEWLPPESEYLIFDGDPTAAAAFKEQFVPLDGMAAERSWAQGETPLDLLAIAIGKSVARANAALARVQAEGGVALVSTVTVRVAINQAELARGRMLVSLARPGEGQTGQFVELIMTTVPGAVPDPDPAPAIPCLPPPDAGVAASTTNMSTSNVHTINAQTRNAHPTNAHTANAEIANASINTAAAATPPAAGVPARTSRTAVFSQSQIEQAGRRFLGIDP